MQKFIPDGVKHILGQPGRKNIESHVMDGHQYRAGFSYGSSAGLNGQNSQIGPMGRDGQNGQNGQGLQEGQVMFQASNNQCYSKLIQDSIRIN